MPERIAVFLQTLEPETTGVLMAIFISLIRVTYDKDETKPVRIILESSLCGALAMTINSGVVALGFGASWAMFVGGTVGYFGSIKIRQFAMNFLRKNGVAKPDDDK